MMRSPYNGGNFLLLFMLWFCLPYTGHAGFLALDHHHSPSRTMNVIGLSSSTTARRRRRKSSPIRTTMQRRRLASSKLDASLVPSEFLDVLLPAAAANHMVEATMMTTMMTTMTTTTASLLPITVLLSSVPEESVAANAVAGLSPEMNIAVFVIGVIPFGIATYEFWRRIAVGASFGTGADSVVIIGEDDAPESSRGRRVLGKGALAIAYVLFALAFGVLALVLYSVATTTMPVTMTPSL